MMITLIAPEALLAKALTDLRSCQLHSRLLRDLADEDGVPWSNIHTFLADMGGFALRFMPASNSAKHCRLYPYSVDAGAESRSQSGGSIVATGEGWRNVVDTGGVKTKAPRQAFGLVEYRQSYQRQASMKDPHRAPTTVEYQVPDSQATSDQETVTQSYVEARRSRDLDPSRFLPGVEQTNSQAEISADPAQQGLQMETLDKAKPNKSADSQIWAQRLRRRFHTRVTNFSQRYGDLIWRLHEPHLVNVTDAFSTLHLESLAGRNDMASTLVTFEGDIWVLTAAQLIEARRRKLVERLPNLTEDEVSDRDKGNFIIKFLAIVQVSWMVIQLISRAILHKSSTPLEIMTLSFAVCAFITYILLLDHPQDVTTPIYLDVSRPSTVEDMRVVARLTPTCFWYMKQLPCVPDNAYHHIWPLKRGRGVSTLWLLIGAGAGVSVFGGIHLVAWNFIFPTVVERNLWRISSLLTLLVPLVDIVVWGLGHYLIHWFQRRPIQLGKDLWYTGFLILSMLAFVLARLFLMVEAFRSLYYLPPDAYSATWAANVPHVA